MGESNPSPCPNTNLKWGRNKTVLTFLFDKTTTAKDVFHNSFLVSFGGLINVLDVTKLIKQKYYFVSQSMIRA